MQLKEFSEMSSETIDETDSTDYRFEIARLQSYASWTVSTVNSKYPEVLAGAGFYYTGTDDKVKCFDCQTVISGWKDELDPMIEHRRAYPKCRFVREIACGDVPIGVDPSTVPPRVPKLKEILQLDRLGLNLNTMIEVYFEDAEDVARVIIDDLINSNYPDFSYYQRRLNSYGLSWPVTVTQKKEDLAAAGFLSVTDEDKVICFSCGGGLQNWEPEDNPKLEHIRWYPNCKFINRVLGGR